MQKKGKGLLGAVKAAYKNTLTEEKVTALSQGIGDVSCRSEMPMTNGYHGRVATYSEYQKKNTRKNSIEGLAFNCSLCGLYSDFSP